MSACAWLCTCIVPRHVTPATNDCHQAPASRILVSSGLISRRQSSPCSTRRCCLGASKLFQSINEVYIVHNCYRFVDCAIAHLAVRRVHEPGPARNRGCYRSVSELSGKIEFARSCLLDLPCTICLVYEPQSVLIEAYASRLLDWERDSS